MVRGAQSGDDEAAAELYDAFYSDIYYHIMKTVKDPEPAADLTQDTFMEILATIGDRIAKIAYSRDGEVICTVTPDYDANGLRVKDAVVRRGEAAEILYTYDDQNRVVRTYMPQYRYAIEFVYDEQNRYTSIAYILYKSSGSLDDISSQDVINYVYDLKGNVVTAEHVRTNFRLKQETLDTYAMEYDAQNRLLLTNITYGHTLNMETGEICREANLAKSTIENTYGTCYYYADQA